MVQFMVCCESLLAHSISRLIIWKKCSQPYTEGVSYGALNAPYNFFFYNKTHDTKHMSELGPHIITRDCNTHAEKEWVNLIESDASKKQPTGVPDLYHGSWL
jgi:hypothetical protein